MMNQVNNNQNKLVETPIEWVETKSYPAKTTTYTKCDKKITIEEFNKTMYEIFLKKHEESNRI